MNKAEHIHTERVVIYCVVPHPLKAETERIKLLVDLIIQMKPNEKQL